MASSSTKHPTPKTTAKPVTPQDNHEPLTMGIDLGFTAVKITLINSNKETVHTVSENHGAAVQKLPADRVEHDPLKILDCLDRAMAKLAKKVDLRRVARIGVAGQMHGVVRWYSAGVLKHVNNLEKELTELWLNRVSTLITCMDKRAQKDSFINTLPKPGSLSLLAEGYGMVSLAWLYKQDKSPYCYDTCGSIGDLLVTRLCLLNKVTTTDHVAATWGYYDPIHQTWDLTKITECGIPGFILPMITPAGSRAGVMFDSWHGVPQDTPVYATVGGMQATFLAHNMTFPNLAILNVANLAQLTVRMPVDFKPPKPIVSAVQYYPYFEDTYLAVAKSQNGGNALNTMVQSIRNIATQLTGTKLDDKQLWAKVEKILSEPLSERALEVKPTFQGERHATEVRGSIGNITGNNLTLRNMLKSTCRGVIANLFEMLPCHSLIEMNVDTILVTGQATKPYYKNVVEQIVNGRMRVISAINPHDASYGAALIADIKEQDQ